MNVTLPHPVEIDGVTHESVTIIDSVEIDLSAPIDVRSGVLDKLTVRRLSGGERIQVRRDYHTKAKRGLATLRLATGLDLPTVRGLHQNDLEKIDLAMAKLDAAFLALDPILSRF